MAITKKPKKEARIDALINKPDPADGVQNVLLRVPRDLLAKIDADRAKGGLKKARHFWILEAVVEKLERGEKSAEW